MEEHHDRGSIEPRSRRDRDAIADPSAWDLLHDPRSSFSEHLGHDRRSIVVDRAKIVAYFEALFEAKFKPIRRGIEATTQAQGTASTMLENGPHERVNCP